MTEIVISSSDEDNSIWEYKSLQGSSSQRFQRSMLTGEKTSGAINKVKSRISTTTKSQPCKIKKSASLIVKHQPVYSIKQEKNNVSTSRDIKNENSEFSSKSKSSSHSNFKKKVKIEEVKVEMTPGQRSVTKDRTDHCPVCQMPFSSLSQIQSPRWHIDECLDTQYSSKRECAMGLDCRDEIPSHYKKFKHTELARSRRNKRTLNDPRNSAKTRLDFEYQVRDKTNIPNSECASNNDTVTDPRSTQTPNDSLSNISTTCTGGEANPAINNRIIKRKNTLTKHIDMDELHKFNSDNVKRKTKIKNEFCKKRKYSENITTEETIEEMSDEADGSIHDIDNIDEESRSLSDMIADIQAGNENSVEAGSERNLSETDAESDIICKDVNTSSSGKNFFFNKQLSSDSDTSDDLEILQTTLTQSKFDDDLCRKWANKAKKKNIEVLEENLEASERPLEYKATEMQSVEEEDYNGNNNFPNELEKSPMLFEHGSDSGDKAMIKNKELFSCPGSNSQLHDTESNFQNGHISTITNDSDTDFEGGFIAEEQETSPAIWEEHTREPVIAEEQENIPVILEEHTGETEAESFMETVVSKVTEIKKNALEILMARRNFLSQTSHACKRRDHSVSKSAATVSLKQPNKIANTNSINAKPCNRLVGQLFGQNSVSDRAMAEGDTSSVASDLESTSSASSQNGFKRKCPFYKKIPGTCFTVDAFRYGNIPDCKAYVLSHFHYDHYMGLTRQFVNPIYCSKITGNLVKKKIGVAAHHIKCVPMNTPTVVENVEITFIDANHCPGSVLILFKLRTGQVYLHTGDFRASQAMEVFPLLKNLSIHTLYLDTTYCDPQYNFPSQQEVIDFAVNLTTDTLANDPDTLIVCGSYTIGKEKIFTAIAEALHCKICVTREKKSTIECLENPALNRLISLAWTDSRLHVLPMNKLNHKDLLAHLIQHGHGRYKSVLGIEPTGWTYSQKFISLAHIKPRINQDNIKVYGIPYSEHSSYLEMKRFVQFTRPQRILPTVNNTNVHSRKKMEVHFEAWRREVTAGKS